MSDMTWIKTSLVNQTDNLNAANYLNEYKTIGLFFSAQWCDPCVKFEEKLSVFHRNINKKSISFGIIVVSDDKSEEQFKEHTSKNPWPAIRYTDFRIKKQLKHRYHVTGLPKLVIVDSSSGRVLNSDAKSNVEDDPTGSQFPWPDPEVSDLLKGPVLFRGENRDLQAVLEAKTVLGFYFSADWCPPCRRFSPTLVRLHSDLKENGFEVLYCSLDKIEEKFLSTAQAMPWPSLPFKDERVQSLAKALQVEDIPQLLMWDLKRRQIINRNAIGSIRQDPVAKHFPWRPKLVTVLTMGNISEMSCQVVILFIVATMDDVEAILPDMTLVAEKFPEYRFYAASDEDVVVSEMREILKVGDQCPYLLFIDFESRVWARCLHLTPDSSLLSPFVNSVTEGEVELVDFPTSG